MKMKTKRLFTFLLAVIMIFGMLPIFEAAAKTSGKLTYEVKNGEVTITDCKESASGKLEIPSTLGGYPVTRIDNYAFSNCKKLTDVTIPDSVKTIGDLAFNGCSGLTSVNIPESVKNIGVYAFSSCQKLKSVTVPGSVKKIADGTFLECTDLASVKISSGVKIIGSMAFGSCAVKSISIPNSVTEIAEFAFNNCEELKSIKIGSGVTSIGESAFINTAYSNDSSNWKNGVLYIGNYLIAANGSVSGAYTVKSGTPFIPDSAFAGCTKLTGITVPDSVKSIGNNSFIGCDTLKSIKLGKNIKAIGTDAFVNTAYYNNSSNWKSDVLYIGNYLIKAKTSIKGNYKIKDGTKCIADQAFGDIYGDNCCDKLTGVAIPDSVTAISDSAFRHCKALTSVTIPSSVKRIGSDAFSGCTKLKNIKLPDSLTSIGSGAFTGTAYDNTSSNWTNGVLYIGKYLVDTDYYVVSGEYAVKDGTRVIADEAFRTCEKMTNVIIPNSVITIGDKAFMNCDKLLKATIPGSVKNIGFEAIGYSEGLDGSFVIPEFSISGHKGSAIYKYAQESGLKFVAHKNNYTSKTVKATTSKNGKITYTCTCGYSYSKSIAKISSVKLSSTSYTYNGKVKQPTVTVKDSKGNTLKNGTDYTVKYSSGRKNVGKYTVTVTFKGKYSGTEKLTFKIVPKSTSISKLTAGTKKFTAKWEKQATQTTGYQLEYSTSSSMKNASRATNANTAKTSWTITGLKASTKYYVRIRTYKNVTIDGKTYRIYSAWSSVNSVKTK